MATAGVAPVPAGGVIADGVYLLTRYDVYAPAAPSASRIRTALRFTGTALEFATGGGSIISHVNYTTSTLGTTLNLAGTCPVSATKPIPYTATNSTLLVFNGATYVQTFTKQ